MGRKVGGKVLLVFPPFEGTFPLLQVSWKEDLSSLDFLFF